jgi:hypothetical protein
MSKKHFIALAKHIRDFNSGRLRGNFSQAQLDAIAFFCEQQNPRFRRGRWMAYIAGTCGPNGGKS